LASWATCEPALNQESPAVYYPSVARVWPRMDMVVRTDGEPTAIVANVRQAVRALDADIPISNVRTEESVDLRKRRATAPECGVARAVLERRAAHRRRRRLRHPCVLGESRTREIGLRMALGASRGGVLRLIVREGMTVGLAGNRHWRGRRVPAGTHDVELVFGVPVHDPATFTW
jgi:putative ABC transport system permease protein